MKGSDQNKKPSANEENTSFISRASYWSPSIGAGIPFIISLRYLPQSTDPNQASIHYSNYYMQDEEEADFGYQYYLPYIPVIILGSFFVSTFFCNSIFGRASNRDSHHNPFYHQIIQGAGDYMPAASAVLYSIFRFGASSVGGERSKAIEGLISKALAALNIVSRLDNKVDESYDYRMDRSPLLDGNVRRIEYVDLVIRDGVVYVVEGLLQGAYYAMEMGVTRIAVNDANRLYIITGLYSGADILEESLIYLLNQFTHYAERIADFRAISLILRSIGVADPSKPIKAVTPKAIDEVDKKIAEEIRELNEAAKQFGNKLKEGAQHLGEDLKEGAEQLGEEIKEGVKKMGDNLHNIGEDIQESFESIGDGLARAFNHSHRSSSSSATAAPKGLHKDDLEHKATNSNSAAEAASTAEKKGLPKDERNYEDKKSSSSSSEVAADSSEVISHQNTIYDLINHIDVFIQMMNGNYEEVECVLIWVKQKFWLVSV